jgi:hypothetical protein
MASLTGRSFDQPDELRTPPMARVAVVQLGPAKVARFNLEPGWRWSDSVKPIVGTEYCQAHHVGVLASGSMHVVHSDGSESVLEPGSAYIIEPGHDAWVEGDEPLVAYEFDSQTAERYATPGS